MAVPELRRLVDAYSHGLLGREAYRRQRAQLLDGLEGGGAAGDAGDTVPVGIPRRPATGPRATGPADPAPRRGLVWLAGGILVAALAGAAWYGIGRRVHAPAPPTGAGTPASQAGNAARPTPKGLVDAFVRRNDWSAGGIADFTAVWDTYTQTEQQAARDAPWFGPLEDALHQRILEQRALDDLGTGKGPSEREVMLVSFARHLGLERDGSLPGR